MRPDSVPPIVAPDTSPSSPPYPELVRARVVAGWDPERAASEPAHPRAKLTPEEVQRARAAEGRLPQIAHDLGVSMRQVRRIRSGRAWKAASPPCPTCGRGS